MKLSVIVITKNEAANIVACLDSVAFADEFIVVDSGSTDNTIELARAMGATVQQTHDWPGFGPQKNRALNLAQGEWVLSIDADERVTPELAQEIQQIIATPSCDAYEIARLSNFCGRFIRHSGWWPDRVLRLFRRGTARFSEAAVHEKVVPGDPGRVGQLRAHFLHYPYPNLDALVSKANRYSSDAAAMMHARGKRSGIWGALGHGAWTFIRIYLIRRGFLDGRHGLVLAVTAAAGSFFRYAKLMFLSENAPGDGAPRP
jgi:glycosyltransferase involved in cell wall biosynthesis